MAPYISNGNYRYLRIFIACKAKIPHRLNLIVDPYGARSFVELEGWMPSKEGSFPPPPCDGRDDIGRNRSDRTRHQDRSNLSSPNEGSSLPVRGSRKIVTTTENNNTMASRPRGDNNRAARPMGMEVYRWVAKTPKETPPVHNINGDKKLTKGKSQGHILQVNEDSLNKDLETSVKDFQIQLLAPQAKILIADPMANH